jgi:hypothetical protein
MRKRMLEHSLSTAMPGLVPGIHVLLRFSKQGVDGEVAA